MNAAPASMPPATPSSAAALRRIQLLPRRSSLPRRGCLLGRCRLLRRSFLRRRLPLGFGQDLTQGALEVVENKPDSGLRRGRRCDPRLALADDEDTAFQRRDLQLAQWAVAGGDAVRQFQEIRGGAGELRRPSRIVERGARDLALVVEDNGGLNLRGDLRQVGERLLRVHGESIETSTCAGPQARPLAQ